MLLAGFNGVFLIDGFPRNTDNLSGWLSVSVMPNNRAICTLFFLSPLALKDARQTEYFSLFLPFICLVSRYIFT